MDWKPFVCRVSCSKIKQKTCFLNRRGSNIMEPRLQYIGAHQIFFLHNRLVGQKYFFAITQMSFNKTQSIWIGLIQLRKWFSMSHKIMFRSVVAKGLNYNVALAPMYWSPHSIFANPKAHHFGSWCLWFSSSMHLHQFPVSIIGDRELSENEKCI